VDELTVRVSKRIGRAHFDSITIIWSYRLHYPKNYDIVGVISW
jgi:hypothetical protein